MGRLSGTQRALTSSSKGEVGPRDRVGVDARFAHTRTSTGRARRLRKAQTEAESKLWQVLRRNGLNGFTFRRQHPVGPYVLDFWNAQTRTAIELDGGQHDLPGKRAADQKRTEALRAKDIRVLRYWNNDVLKNIEGVAQMILAELETSEIQGSTPTQSLPLSGGGVARSALVAGEVDR